jgi:hypothetical protein
VVAVACLEYLFRDGIESLFDYSKSRKSPNSLNGVTRQVLLWPLRTKIDAKTGTSNICFTSALETVFMKDLDTWQRESLTENLTVKRRILLMAS